MNPLDDIAQALLSVALGIDGVNDGRTGEGGVIPETVFVEVGDAKGRSEPAPAGGALEGFFPAFYVVFYDNYTGALPDEEKARLRQIFWNFRTALYADRTLGGLVDDLYVPEWDADITKRGNELYWYWAVQVQTELELEG